MILAAVPALAAAAYYLLALIAAWRWKPVRHTPDSPAPPISLLKPMYGRDRRLYEALRSHACQDYPEFEILFGVRDPHDAALEDIRRLEMEFPSVPMRIVQVNADAPNPKALVLAQLAAEARHPLLVINDDDIQVGPNYFRDVAAPFAVSATGLVTCLYRAEADSWAGRVESLGIATEFAPSVMVARLLGVVEFALGATMALRAETLREIGGFEPIAEYLADDYQLGKRVTGHAHRVTFAAPVVETGAIGASWRQVWHHQLRWSRTVRVSRRSGYYGAVATQATFWALVAFAAGAWWAGAAALILRLAAAWWIGAVMLEDSLVSRYFWLIPIRDLFGMAIWVAGCFGSTVYWRGKRLRLTADGKIQLDATHEGS